LGWEDYEPLPIVLPNFVIGDISSQMCAELLVHMVVVDLVHYPVGILEFDIRKVPDFLLFGLLFILLLRHSNERFSLVPCGGGLGRSRLGFINYPSLWWIVLC
jgi:hypothetical protein